MSTSGTGALAFLRKENIVAPDGYNRWRVPPASIAIHLCIGSVYAWSVFNTPLTRDLGVVALLLTIGVYLRLFGSSQWLLFALV